MRMLDLIPWAVDVVLEPFDFGDCRFDSRRGHGFSSLAFVVCCVE